MSMGKQIREARENVKPDLTIEALAAKVGITPAQLSRIETGKRETSVAVLRRIVRELGMDANILLAFEQDTDTTEQGAA